MNGSVINGSVMNGSVMNCLLCYEYGLLCAWSVMNMVCYEWVCFERGL